MSAIGLAREGKIGAAIVRILESIFGIHMPPPLANLVETLTSDAGLIAKAFAQAAWDAAAENDDLTVIIAKASAAALAEGKTDLGKLIGDWVGIIDRDKAGA
jgi:hypothetical protein